jgi:hypothetical protein
MTNWPTSRGPMIVQTEIGRSISRSESHDGMRLRIRNFVANNAKLVDSETTQGGERAIGWLVLEPALASGRTGQPSCDRRTDP